MPFFIAPMTNAAAPALADTAPPAAEAVKVPTPGLDSLAKSFEPAAIESRWGPEWEQSGQYEPTLDAARPSFAIQLPPPNVTGTLHMGHAFNQTIMDSWRATTACAATTRCGCPAPTTPASPRRSWWSASCRARHQPPRPGPQELRRQGLGVEGRSPATPSPRQMRRMGDSVDWSHEYFTMDEKMSTVVTSTFVKLYEQGLIYRGKRLVNWDPDLKTAVSDLEVESEEERRLHLAHPLPASATARSKPDGRRCAACAPPGNHAGRRRA
jgi:valyl-tRNA synthetase